MSEKICENENCACDPCECEPCECGTEKVAEENGETMLETAEIMDQLLRINAEFDNYKKRNERERLALSGFVKAQTVGAIIPALDNFKTALNSSDDSDFSKGISMIVKKLEDSLTKIGLEVIDPIGADFNPEFHMAVAHENCENAECNTVVEVMQLGYKIGDHLIRPAMVKVAN